MNLEIWKSDSIIYLLEPFQWLPTMLRTKSRLRKAPWPHLGSSPKLSPTSRPLLWLCLCLFTCHHHSSPASSFSLLRYQPSENLATQFSIIPIVFSFSFMAIVFLVHWFGFLDCLCQAWHAGYLACLAQSRHQVLSQTWEDITRVLARGGIVRSVI